MCTFIEYRVKTAFNEYAWLNKLENYFFLSETALFFLVFVVFALILHTTISCTPTTIKIRCIWHFYAHHEKLIFSRIISKTIKWIFRWKCTKIRMHILSDHCLSFYVVLFYAILMKITTHPIQFDIPNFKLMLVILELNVSFIKIRVRKIDNKKNWWKISIYKLMNVHCTFLKYSLVRKWSDTYRAPTAYKSCGMCTSDKKGSKED